MSICRFSSDDWKSDVYAYESVYGGVELHVATNRKVGNIPSMGDLTDIDGEEFTKRHRRQMKALKKAKSVPIGGKYDGKSFTFNNLEELYDFFFELKKEGYHVPKNAILNVAYSIGKEPNFKFKTPN